MDINEAKEWIYDNKSMANNIEQYPFDTWQVRVAQADAAKTQQAYYVLKSHNIHSVWKAYLYSLLKRYFDIYEGIFDKELPRMHQSTEAKLLEDEVKQVLKWYEEDNEFEKGNIICQHIR